MAIYVISSKSSFSAIFIVSYNLVDIYPSKSSVVLSGRSKSSYKILSCLNLGLASPKLIAILLNSHMGFLSSMELAGLDDLASSVSFTTQSSISSEYSSFDSSFSTSS